MERGAAGSAVHGLLEHRVGDHVRVLFGLAQAADDGFDWRLHSGPTASINTGPGQDHTSGHGQYLYTEAGDSYNLTDRTAVVFAPSGIDISGLDAMSLSFWYHMFGDDQVGTIDVAVVSNSPAMREETDVQELYGLRELLAFDVTMYEGLSADALRGVLSDDHDLVHFVGHVSGKGLQTADGWLDARDLPPGSVGARAFVLNACRSYAQGRALVDAGAVGGLCTVSPVGNAPATDVGRTVARLLNAGFTLGGALDVVREASVTGRQYSVVGDPRIVVAEGRGATPIRAHVERLDDDRFRVTVHGYPSGLMDIGTLYMPHLGENDVQHLNSGRIGSLVVDAEELTKYLALERFPVTVAGDRALRWSDSVQLSEFR